MSAAATASLSRKTLSNTRLGFKCLVGIDDILSALNHSGEGE